MNTPSLPSYAGTLTYYNPYSGDAARGREHWLNYLSNASLAKYTADSVGCFLERTNHQQLQALDNATRSINGTLANGFAGVQGGLLAVADEVRGLAVQQAQGNRLLALANEQLGELNQRVQQSNELLAGINVRLALQLEEQRLNNELQGNIAELLRIPDSEKKRHADIEWGLKFFKDASRDADLYHDALKYLQQAEAAMPEDYYVQRQIGFLHLYAPPLLDLEKAVDYLIRAGKYASVDSHPDAVRLGHVLAKSVRRRFSDQPDASAADVARLAAETYRHAAAAEYALGKFPSAVKLIEKGVGLAPKSDTLRFFQAKYLAADGKNDLALAALNTLAPSQEFITAVANDLDLANTVASLWLPDASLKYYRSQVLAALAMRIQVLKRLEMAERLAQQRRLEMERKEQVAQQRRLQMEQVAKQRRLQMEQVASLEAASQAGKAKAPAASGCITVVIAMLGLLALMAGFCVYEIQNKSAEARVFSVIFPLLGIFLLVRSFRISQSRKKRKQVLKEALAACFMSSDAALAEQPVDEAQLVDLLERGLSAGYSRTEMRREIREYLNGRKCSAAQIRKHLKACDVLMKGCK